MRIMEYTFEFERKFLVSDRSIVEKMEGNLIVQSYLAVREGYVVRVRIHMDLLEKIEPLDNPELLEASWWKFVDNRKWIPREGIITVKSPGIDGIRYEAELELAPEVAVHFCRLADNVIIKLRYPVVWGDDLWIVDVFCGNNAPLIMAECERDQPIISLSVPDFCAEEVTNDFRYSNECLAMFPFGTRGGNSINYG